MYENYEIITKKKRDFFNKKLIDVNISFMEGLMISYVGNKPDQNQETLASLSGVDKYRTAKFLSSMEERGLISKKSSETGVSELFFCRSVVWLDRVIVDSCPLSSTLPSTVMSTAVAPRACANVLTSA